MSETTDEVMVIDGTVIDTHFVHNFPYRWRVSIILVTHKGAVSRRRVIFRRRGWGLGHVTAERRFDLAVAEAEDALNPVL